MIRADFIAGIPFKMDGKHWRFNYNPREFMLGVAREFYPVEEMCKNPSDFGVTKIDDHRIAAFRIVEAKTSMEKDEVIDFTIELESLEKVGGDRG